MSGANFGKEEAVIGISLDVLKNSKCSTFKTIAPNDIRFLKIFCTGKNSKTVSSFIPSGFSLFPFPGHVVLQGPANARLHYIPEKLPLTNHPAFGDHGRAASE